MDFPLRNELDSFQRNPNIKNAKKLHEAICTSDLRCFLYSKRENLILIAILKQIPPQNVLHRMEIVYYLIKSATKIIEQTNITTIITLKTILIILLNEIYTETNDMASIRHGLSEEMKIGAMNCISCTFRRTSSDVLEQFYTLENRPFIARILIVCKDILNAESYNQLRLSAMNCVLDVLYVHDEADDNDFVLRRQIADVVFVLFPQLAAKLFLSASHDDVRSQDETTLAVKSLERILCLLFEDQSNEKGISAVDEIRASFEKSLKSLEKSEDDKDILGFNVKNNDANDKLAQITSKKRTKEWLLAAARRISPHIEKLSNLVGSSHKNVQNQLAIFCEKLLTRCQSNMTPCIPVLLQTHLALTSEFVQRHAQTTFELNGNLMDAVEELFQSTLVSMPRIIHVGTENEQKSALIKMHGTVKFLTSSDRLKIILSNERMLNDFCSTLLACVRLKVTNELLETDSSRYQIDAIIAEVNGLTNKTPWKVFENLRSAELSEIVASICTLIGQSEAVNLFVLDYLLNVIRTKQMQCNEALVLTQFVFGGMQTESAICDVVEELLWDERWSLFTEVYKPSNLSGNQQTYFEESTDGIYSSVSMRIYEGSPVDPNESVSWKDVKLNILHMCLIVESIGMAALKLRQEFKQFIGKCLQRITEKTARDHRLMRLACVGALENIRKGFGLTSISELIMSNSHFLVSSIMTSIKHSSHSETAANILHVLFNNFELDAIPFSDSIIESILDESNRYVSVERNISFLKMYLLILSSVQRSLNEMHESNVETKENKIDWNEHFKNWSTILDDNVDAEIENVPSESENESEVAPEEITKSELPSIVKQTKDIMKRCVQYFSSTNYQEKMIAIEVISRGMDIIHTNEDATLQTLHLVWEPFIHQCISDSNVLVMRQCMLFMAKLAKYSKVFIYRRSKDDVFPLILKYLKVQLHKYKTKYDGFSYENSSDFKLFCELLSNLAAIVTAIEVDEAMFDKILDATAWILDGDLPKQLQSLSLDMYNCFWIFNAPAVYVKLAKFPNCLFDVKQRAMKKHSI